MMSRMHSMIKFVLVASQFSKYIFLPFTSSIYVFCTILMEFESWIKNS